MFRPGKKINMDAERERERKRERGAIGTVSPAGLRDQLKKIFAALFALHYVWIDARPARCIKNRTKHKLSHASHTRLNIVTHA